MSYGTHTQTKRFVIFILQVGDGARLRISNGVSDYTVIGTKDVDDATNTRIIISGNTRASPYAENIEYVATAGNHIFYTGGTNEKFRIANKGDVVSLQNTLSVCVSLQGLFPCYVIWRNQPYVCCHISVIYIYQKTLLQSISSPYSPHNSVYRARKSGFQVVRIPVAFANTTYTQNNSSYDLYIIV